MDVSLIIVASCDPPSRDAFDEARDDLEEAVEELVAFWLLDHEAQFVIRTTWKVEP